FWRRLFKALATIAEKRMSNPLHWFSATEPSTLPATTNNKVGETLMSRRSVIASLVCLATIACMTAAGPSAAQQAGPALSGTVTAGPGKLEGVLVSARKSGSTITVTVVSDNEGRYSFPATKL